MADNINIKILNAGAWSRSCERVPVSLSLELEDFIPEVEEFYRNKHSGRKLQWHHLMSNGIITFRNEIGVFDLEVTTFQMAVLFAWNQRPKDRITLENLRLATELPDSELRKTLWSLVAFVKMKRQVVLCHPEAKSPKDFTDATVFWFNQQFAVIKNGKPQKRGKINLIGRLQLNTERSAEDEKEGIVQLRILRTQVGDPRLPSSSSSVNFKPATFLLCPLCLLFPLLFLYNPWCLQTAFCLSLFSLLCT